MVESESEIGLTRRLGKEEYYKNRAQDGAILAVPVRLADRRECSDNKIISQCRDQARWAYTGVVFEVEKEIPDQWDNAWPVLSAAVPQRAAGPGVARADQGRGYVAVGGEEEFWNAPQNLARQ